MLENGMVQIFKLSVSILISFTIWVLKVSNSSFKKWLSPVSGLCCDISLPIFLFFLGDVLLYCGNSFFNSFNGREKSLFLFLPLRLDFAAAENSFWLLCCGDLITETWIYCCWCYWPMTLPLCWLAPSYTQPQSITNYSTITNNHFANAALIARDLDSKTVNAAHVQNCFLQSRKIRHI